MKKLFIFFLFAVIISGEIYSQVHTSKVTTVNGVSCYAHEVKAGETLYGIIKTYNTSELKLKTANDGLDENIHVGQIIYIPVEVNEEKKSFHTVQKKETLYGISKLYDVTVEDIVKANPEVKEGLRIGQVLRIPKSNEFSSIPSETNDGNEQTNKEGLKPPFSEDDTVFYHVVQPQETLYAISKRFMVDQNIIKEYNNGLEKGLRTGDTIIIPKTHIEKREILTKDPNDTSAFQIENIPPLFNKKESYNIVFLLPLYLDNNQNLLTSYINNQKIYDRTQWAIDFYMGAMIAIDSVKKAGSGYNIYTFDTKNDTTILKDILKNNTLQDADLIIGPFFGNEVKIATTWAKQNKKHILIPFPITNKILLDNPYVIKATPSKGRMIDEAADYILQNYQHASIFMVNSGSTKDKYYYDRFYDKFNEYKMNYTNTHNMEIKKAELGSSSGRDLNTILTGDGVNIIIAPSNEITFATNLLTRLNKVSNERKHQNSEFIVIGFDSWMNFHQIDINYKNKLNLHFPSASYFSFNTEELINLAKMYRGRFNTEPSEFSAQGFDVTYYALGALNLFGTEFINHTESTDIPVVKNNFDFVQVSDGCGFENQNVYILRYEDFEIVNANKKTVIEVEKD